MDYQKIIEDIYETIKPLREEGKVANYIPALATANPDRFGFCITTLDGHYYKLGDTEERFSIQSISKVFSLVMCVHLLGEDLWKRVGREPSGTAFNSVIQLELDHGIPRNPFLNSGAIVLADILLEHLENPMAEFLAFVNALSETNDITYRKDVAEGERSVGYQNAAIANMLKYHGNLHGDIEEVLNFYFMMCSVEMSVTELATAFKAFADHKKEFCYDGVRLTSSQVKRLNALMQTCGMYDDAGEFAYLVGLPGKSGVGGGIVSIYPRRYSVAVWSPRLNEKGNSVMGIKALELLTTVTNESIF